MAKAQGSTKQFGKYVKYLWIIVLAPVLFIFLLVGLTSVGVFGELPSFEELENRSCRKTCNGILSNPKEVFLFGCIQENLQTC